MKIQALVLALLLLSSPALAVLPDEMLKDPVLEARAREISRTLRCPVCQGEDIDESNAELAGDLRRLVRTRLEAGDTDEEVILYLRQRYGDYILLKPPFMPGTLVLWLAPFATLMAGLGLAAVYVRRQKG